MTWATITLLPAPPPRRERNCLLLTALKQSCPSRVAARQGCTAPVRRLPGCHSLGEHLLLSTTVRQRGPASEAYCTPQQQIEMSKSRGAGGIAIPIRQKGDCWEAHAGSAQSSSPFIVPVDPPRLRWRHGFCPWVWAGTWDAAFPIRSWVRPGLWTTLWVTRLYHTPSIPKWFFWDLVRIPKPGNRDRARLVNGAEATVRSPRFPTW